MSIDQLESTDEALPSDAELQPCMYCGGEDFVPLYSGVKDRLHHVPGEWGYRRCCRCQSAMLVPMPRAEDLASFYPDVYGFTPEPAAPGFVKRALAKVEHSLLFKPMHELEVRRIINNTGGIGQNKRLLDVGCGRGLRLARFRDKGYDVTGMDFQQDVVDYLERELKIPAVCSDIDGLANAFSGKRFDLVTAYYVMEHVLDVRHLLRTCYDLLEPGGWFAGSVPLIDSVQASVFGDRWICIKEAPRHISFPSRDAIVKLGQEVGYQNVSIRPDSVPANAAFVGITMVPSAATGFVYGNSRPASLFTRLLGASMAFASVPWCWFDNYVLKRPGAGIVFAQRPPK